MAEAIKNRHWSSFSLMRGLQLAGNEFVPHAIAYSAEDQAVALGRRFSIFNEFEGVASGTAKDVAITTPSTGTIFCELHVESTKAAEVEFYEGASITGGTPITPINLNRRSSSEYGGTVLSAPTVSDAGTILIQALLGATGNPNTAVGGQGESHFILKNNETYLIRMISLDTDNRLIVGCEITESQDSDNF